MIEFYDAENLVFYDGAAYADHCQLKLNKDGWRPHNTNISERAEL